ncbi:Gamma-secretase subunit APH-1A, partial [Eurypyga helias]
AFFWLVSLLLSSLIWFIAVKVSDPRDEALQKGLLIFGVMFSVLLQEVFRFLYYKLLRKAIEGLVALSEDGCSPISIQQMAYGECHAEWGTPTAGLGMINLLADSLGPGTVGIHGDSQLYFLTSESLSWCPLSLSAHQGGDAATHPVPVVSCLLTPLLSPQTFCNPLYVGSLVPSYLLMAIAAAWAYVLSGGSAQNLQRFLLCK